jgi:hypothetical protein
MHATVTRNILSLEKPEVVQELPTNTSYKTIRHGVTKIIHVIGCKGSVVTYKEEPDRTDSSTISLAKFLKFYIPA